MIGAATFSSCGAYRYTLAHDLRDRADMFTHLCGTIAFCMLNPSVADAERDDPTIRRCIGFAKGWGYAKLLIVNCYAFRATKPDDMWRAQRRGVDIVCAWGNGGELGRARKVAALIGESKLRCLGISKIGAPWHPLYLPSTLEPMAWRGP